MLIKGENYNLYKGDCLEVMDKLIEQGIKVDLTVTSPPYDDLRNYEGTLNWNFEIFLNWETNILKLLILKY
mgnify:CR=1 FL=1